MSLHHLHAQVCRLWIGTCEAVHICSDGRKRLFGADARRPPPLLSLLLLQSSNTACQPYYGRLSPQRSAEASRQSGNNVRSCCFQCFVDMSSHLLAIVQLSKSNDPQVRLSRHASSKNPSNWQLQRRDRRCAPCNGSDGSRG